MKKRIEMVAYKDHDTVYKNFREDELSAELTAWEYRMKGYTVKIVKETW